MNKNDIDQIRIEIECDGQSALSMMLFRDGTLGRSGNGSLPGVGVAVLGMSDGSAFRTLIGDLNEAVFPHAGAHEMKEKKGTPVMYAVAFLKDGRPLASFEFRTGLENRDAGGLVAYFEAFIQKAVALTNDWHQEALKKKRKEDARP